MSKTDSLFPWPSIQPGNQQTTPESITSSNHTVNFNKWQRAYAINSLSSRVL
jgi:hypothetical protein